MDKSTMPEFGLNQIGQIAVPVTEIERSIAFYRDILGMQFLFQAPPGLGFFDCAGVRLMLDAPARENAGKGSVLYFKVKELQTSFDALVSRGLFFETEPHLIAKMPDHELWMAFFRDPDKNLMALMCEIK